MPSPQTKTGELAVCVFNDGYVAALEVRRHYSVLQDSEAEANGLIRVIDESGDDYVYPTRLFQPLKTTRQRL
ncbi:MAG TPA: hypothetical protein VGM43_24775 [Bryobacteraceae bacterium]|jgi:hypothetical protein